MVSLQFNTRFGIYLYILAIAILFSTGSEIGQKEDRQNSARVVNYRPANR